MQLLHSRGTYGTSHGEELRTERRKFSSETAKALAEATMAEIERQQLGKTRRARIAEEGTIKQEEIKQAGLGKRLEKEQTYARPGQEAEIKRLGALGKLRGAEAGEQRRSTAFTRSREGTLENILEAQERQTEAGAREAELGVSEMERDIRRRDEAEIGAAEERTKAEAEAKTKVEVARPGKRTVNPILKRLWRLSPLGAADYGYKNIGDWLGYGIKKGTEWAFPRTR